ncbi:hypothetical protein BDZ91DRAFT_691192 [Kalaharituber pfeilii]|nr:hypothetical protein BDZ91DRAFT_691192 [Kalaharituber pfeilii]
MHLPSTLLFLSAIASPITAQLFSDVQPGLNATPRNMNISIDVTFPDTPEEEVGGPVIITNGITKNVNIAIVNHENGPIGVQFIGGSLWDPLTGASVRNLTQKVMGLEIEKDQREDLSYPIKLDMHPRELLLQLNMVLRTPEQRLVTATAFNSTVSIVEQPMSIFDPQLLFLYLILLSGIGGAVYWAYNYWLDTVNPKRRRGPRPAPREHAESPIATATGVEGKKFDESWIPEHHIKRASSPKAKGKSAM